MGSSFFLLNALAASAAPPRIAAPPNAPLTISFPIPLPAAVIAPLIPDVALLAASPTISFPLLTIGVTTLSFPICFATAPGPSFVRSTSLVRPKLIFGLNIV